MSLFRIFSRAKTEEEIIVKNSKSKKDLVNLYNWQNTVLQDTAEEHSDYCRYLKKTIHTKDVTKLFLTASAWAELYARFGEGYEPVTVEEFLADRDNVPEDVEAEFCNPLGKYTLTASEPLLESCEVSPNPSWKVCSVIDVLPSGLYSILVISLLISILVKA